MPKQDKKVINLWLDGQTYAWIKLEALNRDLTMTAFLKRLIESERERLENDRRPEQY